MKERATHWQEEKFRRFIAINGRLNSQENQASLIEFILDAAIELTQSSRGFLILKTEGGKLNQISDPQSVLIGRNFKRETLADPDFQYSRSLVEKVLEDAEPILTEEADQDARFSSSRSVHDLKIKSALVVPVSIKGGLVGVIYLDHHEAIGLFEPEDKELLVALADQAGMVMDKLKTMGELSERVFEQKGKLHALQRELTQIKKDPLRYDYTAIIGQSEKMRDIFKVLDQVSDTDIPILICGESGTGKELIAKACHQNSARKNAPFITENCAAVPETLLESEWFGFHKGAFTGATEDRAGVFASADGGTLFLDEIGEMPMGLQAKLLRVLQEQEFRPLGSQKIRKTDIRFVFATNRDLEVLVREGSFREDLYYRLNGIKITVPPLRDRLEDIPELAAHFLKLLAKKYQRVVKIHPEALQVLGAYRWPGNVRELENTLRNAYFFADKQIDLKALQFKKELWDASSALPSAEIGKKMVEMLSEKERIVRSLKKNRFNKSKVALDLGISRKTLYQKMRTYQISPQISVTQ